MNHTRDLEPPPQREAMLKCGSKINLSKSGDDNSLLLIPPKQNNNLSRK